VFTEDYARFSPAEYLAEYYAQLTEENKFLLRFYHDAYSSIGDRERMLEIGGGPTIYQLISASAHVSSIVFSEFLDVNRAEVRKWIENHPQSFQWTEYFDLVSQLESEDGNNIHATSIEARARSRIKEIVHCDLNNENPLSPAQYAPFDVVSSSFCIEGVRNDPRAFRSYLSNAASQLKEKGTLILAMLKECERYKVGEHYFPAFPVDERFMREQLKELNFGSIETCALDSDGSRGFSGILCILAIKTTRARALRESTAASSATIPKQEAE